MTIKTLHNTGLALAVFLCAGSTGVLAHGGGLDKNGGHYDRKTGEYHCHRSGCTVKGASQTTQGAFLPKNHPYSSSSTPMSDMANKAYDNGEIPPYNRKEWRHWSDFDRDCQDTRAETLIKASTIPVTFKSERGCQVTRGHFYDPYSGRYYNSDDDLDIDHVVPIKDAHITGGYKWSAEKKEAFANDPMNVIAVDLGLNRSKGDRWPGEWMPPNKDYACEYLTQWVAVKEKYGLEIRSKTLDMKRDACF